MKRCVTFYSLKLYQVYGMMAEYFSGIKSEKKGTESGQDEEKIAHNMVDQYLCITFS